jgi:hypothetical protein
VKANFTLHTELVRALWYRALPLDVRAFWLYLLAESDTAGWWFPEWEIAQGWLKLPTPLDPAQVQALLVAAGQIVVHPSGWWQLVEYEAQQYPKGLSESQTFQRSVIRLKEQHAKRERAFADPNTPGPSHRPPLNPEGEQETGGGLHAGSSGHGEAQHAATTAAGCREQDPGHSAPGPEAQDPGHCQEQEPKAPTGGPGGEPGTFEGQARELALSVLVNMLRGGGMEPVTEPVKNALGALLDGQGQQGAADTLKAWHKATRRHTAPSLLLWLQDRRDACDHADGPGRRRWWTARLADGQRQKHWRCLVCGHHEAYGPAFRSADQAEGVAA